MNPSDKVSESSSDKARLLRELKTRAVRWGDFTLASGAKSDFYVDCRMVTWQAVGLYSVVRLMQDLIVAYNQEHTARIHHIGGLTMGADPIIAGLLLENVSDCTGLVVRKVTKEHGTKKIVEGWDEQSLNDAPVLIVADVLTSGKSAWDACQAVEAIGGRIAFVAVIVDRQEGGREFLESKGLKVLALTTREELVAARDAAV